MNSKYDIPKNSKKEYIKIQIELVKINNFENSNIKKTGKI